MIFKLIIKRLYWCLVFTDEFKTRLLTNYLRISNRYFAKSITRIVYPAQIVNPQNITIGKNFSAEKNLKLRAIVTFKHQSFSPKITIGDNVHFESNTHIGCISSISIGNNVLLASNVFINDHSHGDNINNFDLPPYERPLFSKGDITIGNNVWIGENAVILSGVSIGDNSIIGANSVVTKDIPANTIAAGAPCKILKALVANEG